jgi:hypothetical protein
MEILLEVVHGNHSLLNTNKNDQHNKEVLNNKKISWQPACCTVFLETYPPLLQFSYNNVESLNGTLSNLFAMLLGFVSSFK